MIGMAGSKLLYINSTGLNKLKLTQYKNGTNTPRRVKPAGDRIIYRSKYNLSW